MKFSKKIINWYLKNKRQLPWRETNDPYKIWLSEVILQQTRINQGLDYYLKFIHQFPDVRSLAAASETEVLKAWQGLGYYSRARNLHYTAREIVEKWNGIFPEDYDNIIGLKGIGEYTAAAISSIAFNQPSVVVDGNVLRFISRYLGIKTDIKSQHTKKIIKQKVELHIDKKQPGTFNQAVMEFGALFCVPANPKCTDCIFKAECYAFLNDKVNSIPLSINKIKQRKRYFNYLVLIVDSGKGKSTCLKQRTGNDIWKNLYDFPLIESEGKVSVSEINQKIVNMFDIPHKHVSISRSKEYKHLLTHRIIYARFYVIELSVQLSKKSQTLKSEKGFIKVNQNSILNYPVPRLIDKFLKENNIFEA